jgi:ribosomal protein S18 acetylase RimI-like enzyme
MIRAAQPEDEVAVMKVASAIGLFDSEQINLLRDMFLKSFLKGNEGSPFWLLSEETLTVCGVVYCEPERMTNGTWNIQFIAVHPNNQKNGLGGALLLATEQALKNRSARIVIVETVGVAEFEHIREFYRSKGYEKESTIRDFYEDGVDKVTFRKQLI